MRAFVAVAGLLMTLTGCSATATNVGPGSPPTGPVPPPPTHLASSGAATHAFSGIDPQARAMMRLVISQHRDLPGGCATLAGERVCVPRVTVDRQRLSDVGVLSAVVGVATGKPWNRLSLHSPRAIRGGIAEAVFQRLLYVEGLHNRPRVTTAQGEALARKELTLYERASLATRRAYYFIPRGQTARQYFLSPRTIAAYQAGLVSGRERDWILQSHRLTRPTVAFDRWFRGSLASHRVLINGRPPTFSLLAALPGT